MERLRHIREQAGYSQQDLADKSGVSQHTISELELGRRRPQGRTLRKLAQVLGVEVADLRGDPASPKAEAPPSPTQPPLNGFDEERRSSILDGALDKAAERWQTTVSNPNATAYQISAAVDAALDLGEALGEELGAPSPEYSSEKLEGIGLIARLLAISKEGNERVKGGKQEEQYRARREQMRELTRRISA